MTRPTLVLLATALAANLPARAQHLEEQDSPCVDVGVTADLVNCLAKARDAADAKLNAAYEQLHAKLDATDGQRLIVTQRLWIRYRDANCSAARDLYDGDTAAPPVYLASWSQ